MAGVGALCDTAHANGDPGYPPAGRSQGVQAIDRKVATDAARSGLESKFPGFLLELSGVSPSGLHAAGE